MSGLSVARSLKADWPMTIKLIPSVRPSRNAAKPFPSERADVGAASTTGVAGTGSDTLTAVPDTRRNTLQPATR